MQCPRMLIEGIFRWLSEHFGFIMVVLIFYRWILGGDLAPLYLHSLKLGWDSFSNSS